MQNQLITCFQDTIEISNSDLLKTSTKKAIQSNKVYKEGFVSKVKPRKENSDIIVEAGTTFETAKRYCKLGRVAVLNFANPENPGGGVQIGAVAQEECLCRSSNLFMCLNNANIYGDYYLYHRSMNSHFYSDRLIYTKDVTVFKDDSQVAKIMPKDEWFTVDVITCAAPYLGRKKYTNVAVLLQLFKHRIKNIMEAARENKADVIILGAFGCGAFKNPPLVVAEAFRQVICEENYFRCFKKIVFAIKPNSDCCQNLRTFMSIFHEYAKDASERCKYVTSSLEERFNRIPQIPYIEEIIEDTRFIEWQKNNAYYGKQFSILGDSISTLEGYNPRGYHVFYDEDNCKKSGVIKMEDTWWDKVIAFCGGELLVNNSWSGSRVTKLPGSEKLFPSGCSDERTSALHIKSVMPDVIIIYLGTNDWAFGVRASKNSQFLHTDQNELFTVAYERMLKKIRKNYPKSEIWCCSLSETFMGKNPNFKFPHTYAGTHIEEFNTIIQNICLNNKCKFIDIYNQKMPYDSIDGSHPTRDGMNTIATAVIKELIK